MDEDAAEMRLSWRARRRVNFPATIGSNNHREPQSSKATKRSENGLGICNDIIMNQSTDMT